MQTYNDVFVEELVRRSDAMFRITLRLLSIVLGMALVIAGYFAMGLLMSYQYANTFTSVIFFIAVLGVFYTFRFTVKEYEYAFFSGDVDVDQILGKRKRKRLISFGCRDVELMAPLTDEYKEQWDGVFDNIIDASKVKNSPENWFIILRDENEKYTLLVFSPSRRMLDAFAQFVRGTKLRGYERKAGERE